jgi:hypothetical protein
MGVQTISAQKAAEKWTRKANASTQDYTDGINAPRTPWASSTAAAEGNYEAGVQAGIAKKRFGAGVRKAGDSTWQKGATEKGGARWAPGIAAAADKFGAGIAGVLQTISGVTLPPRGIKGDPRNLQRVTVIANALHAKKIS